MSPWAPPPLPTWWATSGGPVLVGREGELEELERIWAAAEAGVRQVLFLGGEPGAGKTRLVTEAAVSLERAGVAVLLGHCLPDSPVAYQPFRDPIRELGPAVEEVVDPQDREHVRERLAALVGHAGEPEVPATRDVRARQVWDQYDALVDVLRGLTGRRPVVLVLEDLHWATTSTLQLLSHLVRHLKEARLLVVATHRTTAPDRSARVVATIADLYRDPGVHRLDLVGLRTSAVAEFLRLEADLTAERAVPVASRLREETGGNPFFLQEICRGIRAGSEPEADATVRVPGTVRDAFAARLGLLDESAGAVVELAAVLGERPPAALLIAASPYDEDTTLAYVPSRAGCSRRFPGSGTTGSPMRWPGRQSSRRSRRCAGRATTPGRAKRSSSTRHRA